MPTAFLQPDSRLLRACEESTVLTSNERLRRELVRAYDSHQQDTARSAWRSANVFSLDGYLNQHYYLVRGRRPEVPQLLTPEAELLVFQQQAPDQAAAMSRVALQAWNLLHAWAIPLTEETFGHTDNGRVFLAWARRVREQLQRTASLTRSELPGFLANQLRSGLVSPMQRPVQDAARGPAGHLVCLGFESVTTAVNDYFAALEQCETEVELLGATQTQPRNVARTEFPSAATELGAIAQWCRGILEVSPGARVGVVIPDLAARHHQVSRHFGAELEDFAHAGIAAVFDVAAGLTLREQPIWRAAQSLLELCTSRLPVSAAYALLTSRYLDLPGPLLMRPELPSELTLGQLAEAVGHPRLVELSRMCLAARTRATYAAWARHFSTLLRTAGWTGGGAQSGQYQAWEQLQATLDRAASAPVADFMCRGDEALSLLQQSLDARLFAPRTAAAPVQVMGYLETTGLRFTHLWIGGMHDTAWPAPVAPNPFIPLSSQLLAQIPRTDQPGELEFARSRMAHWLGSSEQVVFSHVLDHGEAAHLASPLTADIALTSVEDLVNPLHKRSHPFFEPRLGELESFSDDFGTALGDGRHAGGSGLLKDQAACPFRAWAIHRMGLRDARGPHGFPDALDRGNLVHEALHRMLAPAAVHDAMPRHPDDLAPNDVATAADAALRRHYRRFPDLFVDRERDRLTQLLTTWLEFESQRSGFQVVSVESDAELEVAGLTLSLRLDRVDRVNDALLVIDYKTGQARAAGLNTPRLAEPQLPSYAVSREHVAAVLFAKVDATRPGLVGLADDSVDVTPARLEAMPGETWSEVKQRWRGQLHTLAEEFKSGRAAVDPLEKATCEHCHLHSLCRVGSRALAE